MSELGPLLILGTSNSVVRGGYTSVLEPHFGPISNFSIGASTSVLPSFRTRDLAHLTDQWVVLDYCVNEGRLNHNKGFDGQIQRDSVRSFLAYCGEQRLKPVVLIMPSHWKMMVDGPIRARYADFAREHRLPWFDGFAFNERLYRLEPSLERYGYAASAHPESPISRLIGRALARGIAKFGSAVSFVTAADVPRVVGIYPEDHHPADRLVRRNSTIDDRTTISIRPGASVSFPIEPGDEIVGVAINACESNAVLRLDAGAGARLKDLSTSMSGMNRYLLVVWPLFRPLSSKGDRVTLDCLDKRETPEVDERNDHLSPRTDLADPRIELAGLIVRRGHAPAMFPAFDAGVDVATLLTDDELRAEIATEIAFTANGAG